MGSACSNANGEITPDGSVRGRKSPNGDQMGDQTSVGSNSLPIKSEGTNIVHTATINHVPLRQINGKHRGGGSMNGMHSPPTAPTIGSSTGILETEGHFSFTSNNHSGRILPPINHTLITSAATTGLAVPLAVTANSTKNNSSSKLPLNQFGGSVNAAAGPFASGSTSYYSNNHASYNASATKYRGGPSMAGAASGLGGNQSVTVGNRVRGRGGGGNNSSVHSMSIGANSHTTARPSGYSSVLNKPKPGELLRMSVTQAQEYGMGNSKTNNGMNGTMGGGGGRGGRRVVATRAIVRGATLVPGPLLFDEHQHAASVLSASGGDTRDNSLSNINTTTATGNQRSSFSGGAVENLNDPHNRPKPIVGVDVSPPLVPSSTSITGSKNPLNNNNNNYNQISSTASNGSPLYPISSTKAVDSQVPSEVTSPIFKPQSAPVSSSQNVGINSAATCRPVSEVASQSNLDTMDDIRESREPTLKRTLLKPRRAPIAEDIVGHTSSSGDDDDLELLQESFCSSTQLVSHDMALGSATPGAGGSILGRSQRRKSHRMPTPQQRGVGTPNGALNLSVRMSSRGGTGGTAHGRVGSDQMNTPPIADSNMSGGGDSCNYSITKPADFLSTEASHPYPPIQMPQLVEEDSCHHVTNTNHSNNINYNNVGNARRFSLSNNNSIVANGEQHKEPYWKVMGANPSHLAGPNSGDGQLTNGSIAETNGTHNNNVFFLGCNSTGAEGGDSAKGSPTKGLGNAVVGGSATVGGGATESEVITSPLSNNNQNLFNSSNPDVVVVIGRQARRQRGASTTSGLGSSVGIAGGGEQQPSSFLTSPHSAAAAAPCLLSSTGQSTPNTSVVLKAADNSHGSLHPTLQYLANAATAGSHSGVHRPFNFYSNGAGSEKGASSLKEATNKDSGIFSPSGDDGLMSGEAGRSFGSSLIREAAVSKAIVHPNVVENEISNSLVSTELPLK